MKFLRQASLESLSAAIAFIDNKIITTSFTGGYDRLLKERVEPSLFVLMRETGRLEGQLKFLISHKTNNTQPFGWVLFVCE